VRFLHLNPADCKDIQRGPVSLDLRIEHELSSFSMIQIEYYGNNTCHHYLDKVTIYLIKLIFLLIGNKRNRRCEKLPFEIVLVEALYQAV
jgi:hypothetical protein